MSRQSVLQPVDVNIDHSPARKRARFGESLDQKDKSNLWSLSNGEVILHEVYDHGIGRLDCDSEVVTDDDTIFNKNQPIGIDVSCASMTPNTRGKQTSYSVLSSLENLRKLGN